MAKCGFAACEHPCDAQTRIHAAFSIGKCFHHVDKNSRDGINKKCFTIIIRLPTFNGKLKCQISRKMQRLIVKLQRVNSLFPAKRLNRVTGTFSNYRPLFRILSINQFKITGLWFQLEDTRLPMPFGSFCNVNFINLFIFLAGMESWKVGIGFAHQRKSRVFTLLEANKSTSFLLFLQRIIIHEFHSL